jgi:ubiquinone/menaquinone biosynthesis C-methylase UbiE/predicted transcriptional regulator
MGNILEKSKEIRKIWSGFQSARVLITANNFRIFDYLEKPKTVRELAKRISTDRRATEILLDALTGLGLLKKQKDRYRNSRTASRFLVSRSPYYQGDIIRHVDSLWDKWSDLDKVIKTGVPSRRPRNHEAFILGMHNLAILKVKEIIQEIGLDGVRKALDLGGGPGTYTIEMAKKGIHVTLFDTPETIKIARKVVAQSRVSIGDIVFIKGDFFNDDLGRGYDLILVSQVLHAYSGKDNIKILKKCRKALNKNGRMVIQEFFINENRVHPVQGSLFSINMLVNTEKGRTYTPGEIKNWLVTTGFRSIRKKIVADGVLLVSARK